MAKNVSPFRHKNSQHVIMVVACCIVKSRFTLVIKNINLGTRLKETLDNISSTTSGGRVPTKVICTFAFLLPGVVGAARTAVKGSIPPGGITEPAMSLVVVHRQVGVAART